MKKTVKVALLLMIALTVLTVIYTGAVAYKFGFADGAADASERAVVKDPIAYGIWHHYFAEKLSTEPEEWYTSDELGIILLKSHYEGRFHIYIVDEEKEKAFRWMRDNEFKPRAVKYEGEFYEILGLWVFGGLDSMLWEIPTGIALGLGWVFAGALFLKGRKQQ